MSVLNCSGGVCRAIGCSGRRVAAARVLLAPATAAQQQTASSATVAAAAASRHTSLPPPLPLELSSTPSTPPKTPADYHYPFGNASLLISTLPSLQQESSPSAVPRRDVSSKKPPPTPTEDDAAVSGTSPRHRIATPAGARAQFVPIPKPTPRSPKKKTPNRAPGRLEARAVDGAKAGSDAVRPVEPVADRQRQHRTGRDGAAAALEGALAEDDADASVDAAVELPTRPLSDPIHILGSDPRATYLAHLLAGIPNSPPVRLVLMGRARQNRWNAEGRGVRVLRAGNLLPRHNVEAELARSPPMARDAFMGHGGQYMQRAPVSPAPLPPIENLVVTLGCAGSIDAIQKLQHRIDHRTTICLVQCGLGVVERLNELCFPDAATRPRYLLGHMTHSLGYNDRSFTVSELKPGKLFLTAYTAYTEQQPTLTTAAAEQRTSHGTAATADDGRHLVHLLSTAPFLGAGGYAAGDFLRWALPAILYTAAVEPVATVLELPVDALWHNGEARTLVEALLDEMLAVVWQLPETQASPALAEFVQSGTLQRQVLQRRQQPQKHNAAVLGGSGEDSGDASARGSGGGNDDYAGRAADAWADDPSALFASASRSVSASAFTSTSTSTLSTFSRSAAASPPSMGLCTMAQRVRMGRVTDMEFLNGYFVRRGRDVGVACPMNEMAMRLVRSKQLTNRARLRAYIPLVGNNGKPFGRGRDRSMRNITEADIRMADDRDVYFSAVLPQPQSAPEAAQPPAPRRVPEWWRLSTHSS